MIAAAAIAIGIAISAAAEFPVSGFAAASVVAGASVATGAFVAAGSVSSTTVADSPAEKSSKSSFDAGVAVMLRT